MQAYVGGGQLPGAFAAVLEGGEVVYQRSEGWKQNDAKRFGAQGERAIYRMFSMTKALVATVALMLVERKQLDLDAPISKYLSEFKKQHPRVLVLGQGDNSEKLVPPKREISLRDLLTHRSGLAYGFFLFGHPIAKHYKAAGVYSFDALFDMTSDELAAALSRVPLMYEPGTSFNYGLSTDLVGCILERVTKKSLREVLRDELLQPLGMVDTDFYVPADKVDRVRPIFWQSPGWGFSTNAPPTEVKTLKRGLGEKPKLESGGGGLFSTAQDYIKFMKLLLHGGLVGGKRLLQQSTVNQLTRVNQLPGDVDSSLIKPGLAKFRGLGWSLLGTVLIDPARAPGATLSGTGEYGWGGYASTYFQIDPERNIAYIFLTQLMPSIAYPIRQQVKFMVHKCATASQASSETDKAKACQ